jgi:hypothetical protein
MRDCRPKAGKHCPFQKRNNLVECYAQKRGTRVRLPPGPQIGRGLQRAGAKAPSPLLGDRRRAATSCLSTYQEQGRRSTDRFGPQKPLRDPEHGADQFQPHGVSSRVRRDPVRYPLSKYREGRILKKELYGVSNEIQHHAPQGKTISPAARQTKGGDP